jgi:phosphoserine phosphatase RsbU/P
VLFSDGITEAENPEHELFEPAGLARTLAGKEDVPLEELQESILDSVRGFTQGGPQTDDMTLLLVRYRARQ